MSFKTSGVLLGLLTIALSACGGGGGGGGGTPATNPPPTLTPNTTTIASGTLVHDADGSPFANITVTLYPWTAGSTTVVAQTTTNASGQFTLSAVPNATYLLVAGSNSVTDTTFATVHDRVVLSGGNQTLVAPTLPAVHAYAPPTWETNGDYRLAAIDATTEAPCLTDFNTDRVNAGQTKVPFDEWSLENARANVANRTSTSPGLSAYVSTQNTQVSSSNPAVTCQFLADGAFPPNNGAYANDARVAWFGGKFIQAIGLGNSAAPFDPRGYTDPIGNWP